MHLFRSTRRLANLERSHISWLRGFCSRSNTNAFSRLPFSPLTPPFPLSWGRGEGRGGALPRKRIYCVRINWSEPSQWERSLCLRSPLV
jgi:hypothetical protein